MSLSHGIPIVDLLISFPKYVNGPSSNETKRAPSAAAQLKIRNYAGWLKFQLYTAWACLLLLPHPPPPPPPLRPNDGAREKPRA